MGICRPESSCQRGTPWWAWRSLLSSTDSCRNPVNSQNSVGIKFGRGACQIHTMIATESWIKFKFRRKGSGNHPDGMHRNGICSYTAYNANALNPTSPLPPSSSTMTIQHAASPLSPTATTIHGLHPLPSTTTAGPRCSNNTPTPRRLLTRHTANECPREWPLPPPSSTTTIHRHCITTLTNGHHHPRSSPTALNDNCMPQTQQEWHANATSLADTSQSKRAPMRTMRPHDGPTRRHERGR